jgi:hypothetical protein
MPHAPVGAKDEIKNKKRFILDCMKAPKRIKQ